jgi:SAM-dependent methyltransferase
MKAPRLLAFPLLLAGCTLAFEGGGLIPTRLAPPARVAEDRLDVPYVPTPPAVVEAMLDLAEVGPDDYLIDLGSGDGRIAIAAARRGARALGVDIDPARVAEANLAASIAGVQDRVQFRRQDIFETPIDAASVVTMYLLPEINLRLRPRLLTELRPGTRIVSHAFGIGDWAPDEHRVIDGRNVFLWIVPATVEGRWELSEGGGAPATLALEQRFQAVTGTLAAPGRVMALRDTALRGVHFRFTVDTPEGPRTYRGRVSDDAILPEDGGDWVARRVG